MWTSDTGHSVTILNNMYKNKIQNNSRTNRRYMNLKPRPIENNTKYFYRRLASAQWKTCAHTMTSWKCVYLLHNNKSTTTTTSLFHCKMKTVTPKKLGHLTSLLDKWLGDIFREYSRQSTTTAFETYLLTFREHFEWSLRLTFHRCRSYRDLLQ